MKLKATARIERRSPIGMTIMKQNGNVLSSGRIGIARRAQYYYEVSSQNGVQTNS